MSGQIYAALVFAVCGVLGGALYDAMFPLRLPRLPPWVRTGCDAVFGLLFAFLCVAVSVSAGLSAFRGYFLLSCLLGFALYAKTLHKTVAFLAKKIYNTIKPIQKEKKLCPKREERVLRRKKSERS